MIEIANLHLAPAPKSIERRDGVFSTAGKSFTQLISEDPQSLIAAVEQTGLDWEITASPKAPKNKVGLVIKLDEDSDILEEGYELAVLPESIEITASDPAGAFYGACTLAQIMKQCGEDIPCMSISDSPDFSARGVMLDISRDKVPTMDTLYHLVDLLASWKINQLQLYTEHTFAYHAHPKVWEKASPMTGEQILALDAYCCEKFIDLVPNQNSFGHMERWLKHEEYRPLAESPDSNQPFSLCPIDEGSTKFLRGLYEELLPHFSSGLFNVGCDETFDLGHGRSKALCEEQGTGRVYLDFLLKIYEAVEEHSRIMMFWGDIIMHHPELIPELPDDLIALEWGYEFDHPFAENGKKFADSGIPFYVCPGTSSWNSLAGRTENAIGNITNAAENGLELGAIGLLNTDWGDCGHWQPLSASYLGYLVGAMASWNSKADVRHGLAEKLSLHAFGDSSGKTGRAYYDVGDIYRVFKTRVGNSSIPWRMLFRAESELVEKLEVSEFDEMESKLDSISKAVEGGEMTCPDADIVGEELDHILNVLRFSAEVGKMKTGGAELKDSKAKIAEIKNNHERVWLMRNRIGGLSDSLAKLRSPQ